MARNFQSIRVFQNSQTFRRPKR